MLRKYYRSSAFTLVELMIVIAIIGILAAALFPSLTSYLARARDTARYNGAKDVHTALLMYLQDHGEYPTFARGYNPPGWTTTFSSFESDDNGITRWNDDLGGKLQGYIGKMPNDPVRKWPLAYWYITPAYYEAGKDRCPESQKDSQFSIIFATETSRGFIGSELMLQGEGGSYGRYCLGDN